MRHSACTAGKRGTQRGRHDVGQVNVNPSTPTGPNYRLATPIRIRSRCSMRSR